MRPRGGHEFPRVFQDHLCIFGRDNARGSVVGKLAQVEGIVKMVGEFFRKKALVDKLAVEQGQDPRVS